jgi:hypothetical protein
MNDEPEHLREQRLREQRAQQERWRSLSRDTVLGRAVALLFPQAEEQARLAALVARIDRLTAQGRDLEIPLPARSYFTEKVLLA